MKYILMARVIPLLMKGIVFDYLGSVGISVSPADVRTEYKAILARQPEIGGMKNNLIAGLFTAAYAVAVYRVADGEIDETTFEGLVNAVCVSDIFRKMSEGKDFFTEKNISTRNMLQNDPYFNSFPENWKYTFTYDLSVPECFITYSRCAICEMARREGTFHLMKYLCTTDYAQQELMGNTLVRTKTIGNGDDICDFHIIGNHSDN